MSLAMNDPEDVLHLWQQAFGFLEEEQREDFLFDPTVEEICFYHIDLIEDAINKNNARVKDILLYVQSHPHKPREENGEPYLGADVGAYFFEGKIYSVRRDRKSNNLQAWEFDKVKLEYKRPFFSSDERRILSSLNSNLRLSLALAQKYSIETGLCCHCGRYLTAKKSVANGMGPVCKSYYQ